MRARQARPKNRGRKAGFTLVELMVVLVILGLLAGLVGNKVVQYIARAKATTAQSQIKSFHNAVKTYYIDTGYYPEQLEDLIVEPAGVTGWDPEGYLEFGQIPLDPWGNEYIYQFPGDRSKFDIYSLGADGKDQGEGEDADIYNSGADDGADEF